MIFLQESRLTMTNKSSEVTCFSFERGVKMKILITGGAGFIGSHVVDLAVEAGHDVVVVDDLSTGKVQNLRDDVTFYQEDVADHILQKIFEKERPEGVIHLAAQISVAKSVEDPLLDLRSNLQGSVNILENCRRYQVGKVVFSSSAAVYGEPNYVPLDEEHPLHPMSPYGMTKATAESYFRLYYNYYGIEYAILRYSNVYGPRQDACGEGGVVSIFINRLLNDMTPVVYGEGTQTRDFIYVEDVARANIAALTRGCGVFNVSCNGETSVNELLSAISKILGSQSAPVYAQARKGDIARSILDNSKAKESLKWTPQVGLEEGLIETVRFFKDEHIQEESRRLAQRTSK